jgi:hypothetical protein
MSFLLTHASNISQYQLFSSNFYCFLFKTSLFMEWTHVDVWSRLIKIGLAKYIVRFEGIDETILTEKSDLFSEEEMDGSSLLH